MGVDYQASGGIGYKVEDNGNSEADLEDGLYGFLEYALLECFDVWVDGDQGYSGTPYDVYVTIKDPFKSGLDLTEDKAGLEAEIDKLKCKTIGKFGEQCGLQVY